MPGVGGGNVDALTTNVDICATLADIFGVEMTHRTHGYSMLPLIAEEAPSIRDWALAGIWGREVHLIDPESKYARAPADHNAPLSLWSNRWSTMPIHHLPEMQMPPPDERAVLDRMPGARIPVIRQPFRAGDLLPFWAMGKFSGNHLYRVRDDPAEEANLAGTSDEKHAAEKLRAALIEMEAPKDQFERLALA
jgi:arylsulfatase A-like enzyme